MIAITKTNRLNAGKGILLFMLSMLCASVLFAQQRVVTGKVLDENNQPLPGASVEEVGAGRNGTFADDNGVFQITLRGANSQLSISSVGYLNKRVAVGAQRNITIPLLRDTKGLEDVIVVGFGRQKRITNTGAVSSISGEMIRGVPTSNVANTLVGRLPGFFAQQRSGQPGGTGGSGTEFYIRGANSLRSANRPLIVVDDIEYTYEQVQQLDANEIETFTILKDASTTAIYGIRGANGVLVITTRRGKVSKPQINVTAEAGMQKVIRMPTYLDAYSTALLRNEATINDSYGLTTPLPMEFTERDLELFKSGTDPMGHPNINWVETLLNTTAMQSRYNVDISGGNSLVKYFTSLGYYSQDGIMKDFTPEGSDVNNNYYYRRYNFRSNLDITPTKTLKLRFDINGRFAVTNSPNGAEPDNKGVMYDISRYSRMAPYAFPLVNPNGTYGFANYRNGDNMANPISRIGNGGYKRLFNNDLNIVVGAEQQLGFITKGLSAKGNVSYASATQDFRNLTRDVNQLPAYRYNPVNQTYTIKNISQAKFPIYLQGNGNNVYNNTVTLQAWLNYDRTFGNHHVSSLAMFNRRSYVDKAVLPQNYQTTTMRVDYDFKRKYMFNFTLARNGNDLFQEDIRYGIFPAAAIAWNLSEEKFFKNIFPVFDLFKIRATYGIVGTDDGIAAPVLSQVYNSGQGNYNFGQTSIGMTGIREGGLINPLITWENERKTDIGIDINMWKGKLAISADYFYNYRYDQLIRPEAIPNLLGQTGNNIPLRNVGISENKGLDGMITYTDKFGKLDFSMNATASYAINKVIFTSEAPDYPNLAQTGRQLGLTYGYVNLGFYGVDDFDASGKVKKGIAAPSWSVLQPGDLKYQDLNGDGTITTADRMYLKKPNLPTTTYGTTLSFGYKGITLNALVQGAFNYSLNIFGEGAGDAFNSNLRPWNLGRWTPATAATATYPRIGLNTNLNNVSWQTPSDFWYVDASYVRLKSLELGYRLPQQFISKAFMKSARVYATAYNLLSINKTNHFQQDPEVASGDGRAYPNTANFNLGVQVGF